METELPFLSSPSLILIFDHVFVLPFIYADVYVSVWIYRFGYRWISKCRYDYNKNVFPQSHFSQLLNSPPQRKITIKTYRYLLYLVLLEIFLKRIKLWCFWHRFKKMSLIQVFHVSKSNCWFLLLSYSHPATAYLSVSSFLGFQDTWYMGLNFSSWPLEFCSVSLCQRLACLYSSLLHGFSGWDDSIWVLCIPYIHTLTITNLVLPVKALPWKLYGFIQLSHLFSCRNPIETSDKTCMKLNPHSSITSNHDRFVKQKSIRVLFPTVFLWLSYQIIIILIYVL